MCVGMCVCAFHFLGKTITAVVFVEESLKKGKNKFLGVIMCVCPFVSWFEPLVNLDMKSQGRPPTEKKKKSRLLKCVSLGVRMEH